MSFLFGWLVSVHARWQTMTDAQQWSAGSNLALDLLLVGALFLFIHNGVTGDPKGLLFWPPFLAVVLFFRFKRMQERWKI